MERSLRRAPGTAYRSRMKDALGIAGRGVGIVLRPVVGQAVFDRVADQLGIAASDVLFAEPDLPQSYAMANERSCPDQPFADIGGF